MVNNLIVDNEPALCEKDSGYTETLYLSQDPKVRKEILEGKATPIEGCIPEEEVAALFSK